MSFQNQLVKVERGYLSSSLNSISLIKFFFLLFIFLLPTQFGPHFWRTESIVSGFRIDYYSLKIYLQDVLVFLLVALILYKNNTRLLFIYYLKTLVRNTYLIIFVFVVVVGIFYSSNMFVGILGFINLVEFILTIIISIVIFKTYKSISTQALFVLLVSLLFQSAIIVFQFYNQSSINGILYFLGERRIFLTTANAAIMNMNGNVYLRPYGTFSHPNVASGFLILSLPFVWQLRKNIQKVFVNRLFFLGLMFVSLAVLLTFSRASVFILLVYAVFSLIDIYKKRSLVIKDYLFLSIVALFTCIYFSKFYSRFFQNLFTSNSFTERFDAYKMSLLMIDQNYILGVGLNNYIANVPRYIADSGIKLENLQPVHSLYLLTLSEMGIIGIGIIFLFIFILYSKIYKKSKSFFRYEFLFLFAVIFLGIFDHYISTSIQVRLLLAVLFGYLIFSNIYIKVKFRH